MRSGSFAPHSHSFEAYRQTGPPRTESVKPETGASVGSCSPHASLAFKEHTMKLIGLAVTTVTLLLTFTLIQSSDPQNAMASRSASGASNPQNAMVSQSANGVADNTPGACESQSVDEPSQGCAKALVRLFEQGKKIFRFDTFGDEDFWGSTLQLHKAVEGAALGGV